MTNENNLHTYIDILASRELNIKYIDDKIEWGNNDSNSKWTNEGIFTGSVSGVFISIDQEEESRELVMWNERLSKLREIVRRILNGGHKRSGI